VSNKSRMKTSQKAANLYRNSSNRHSNCSRRQKLNNSKVRFDVSLAKNRSGIQAMRPEDAVTNTMAVVDARRARAAAVRRHVGRRQGGADGRPSTSGGASFVTMVQSADFRERTTSPAVVACAGRGVGASFSSERCVRAPFESHNHDQGARTLRC
jgi:hypothetical protein